MIKRRIVMVGPATTELGGIARVVGIWRESGLFDILNITYVPSSAGQTTAGKVSSLLHGLFRFISLLREARLTYIHTAVDTSFYRKSLFLAISILFKTPVLLHIHPAAFTEFIKRAGKKKKIYIFSLLQRVSGFVVLTHDMRNEIVSIFPGKPVFVLRNPVNIEEMNRTTEPRAECRILYLGWYIREKGVYELVDALGILKESGAKARLNLYGTKGATQLKRYVQVKDLTHMIAVNGWIEHKEKVAALHAHTMLVLPSHTEGIPNVILEAMATKTPIVATSVGGMKEILRDGENALIAEVNNPADLSKKICQMLQDSDLRTRLFENAYRDAAEKYDIGIIKGQFIRIIESAMNES